MKPLGLGDVAQEEIHRKDPAQRGVRVSAVGEKILPNSQRKLTMRQMQSQ